MIVTRKEQIHLCSAIAIQTCLVSRSIYLEQALRVCAMCVRLCKLQWSRRTQIKSDQQFNSHQRHHTSSNHYFPFSLKNAACLWEPTIGLTSEDPERLQTITELPLFTNLWPKRNCSDGSWEMVDSVIAALPPK